MKIINIEESKKDISGIQVTRCSDNENESDGVDVIILI